MSVIELIIYAMLIKTYRFQLAPVMCMPGVMGSILTFIQIACSGKSGLPDGKLLTFACTKESTLREWHPDMHQSCGFPPIHTSLHGGAERYGGEPITNATPDIAVFFYPDALACG
jgi:hypothetical protein